MREWLVATFLHLFVFYRSSRQPCWFFIILLLYAPLRVISELVLFVIFGGLLLVYFYIRRPSVFLYTQAFVDFSCYFRRLFCSLHFSLFCLLHHVHNQWLRGNGLLALTYSPMSCDVLLGLFGLWLSLLWIKTPCNYK